MSRNNGYRCQAATPAPEGFLTVAEIAQLRKTDEARVRVWIRNGQLRARLIHGDGRRHRYIVAAGDFEDFVARFGLR